MKFIVDIIRGVAKCAVSAGTGTIVTNIIKTYTKDEPLVTKICTGIAAYVACDYVIDKMTAHTDVLIDDTVKMIAEAKEELDKMKITKTPKMEEVK